MATIITPRPVPEPARPLRRTAGRLQLLLILAVTLGPMVLATFMYKWQFWVPTERNYHGVMLGNGVTRNDIGVASDETRWQLLVTSAGPCQDECRTLVYLARQLQIGLGRDASRASHALASAQPLPNDYEAQLRREYPQLKRPALDPARYRQGASDVPMPALWIVDPHGNLVLRYDARAKGKDILNDLRHLLKLSNIG